MTNVMESDYSRIEVLVKFNLSHVRKSYPIVNPMISRFEFRYGLRDEYLRYLYQECYNNNY